MFDASRSLSSLGRALTSGGPVPPAMRAVPGVGTTLRARARSVSRGWAWPAFMVVAILASLADGFAAGQLAAERDTGVFYYPLFAWIRSQVQQGVFPLWAPVVFGGYPLFADGELGLANPLVLAALLLPVDFGFVLLRFVFLSIAAGGTYLLARGSRLSRPAAALAGITLALGSFFQAQIHHENIIRTAAWLPLACACADRALRGRGPDRLSWTVRGALVVGLASLGLHVQLLALDLLALAGYGLLRWVAEPIGGARGWWQRGLVLVRVFPPLASLGVLIGAVQLLPLAELARFSARGASGLPYPEAAAYSLTPLGLAQLLIPFFFRDADNRQWGLWTHWESYLYVGLVPLLLVVAAPRLRRRTRALLGWATLALVALMGALGQYAPVNVHFWLTQLPGMSGLRAPGRLSLVVTLALAMLAAHGLHALMVRARCRSAPRARTRALMLGFAPLTATVLLAGGLVTLNAWLRAEPGVALAVIDATYLAVPRDTYPLTASGVYQGLLWSTNLANPAVGTALVGLAAASLGLLLWQAPWAPLRRWRWWPHLLAAGAAIDLVLFSRTIHPRVLLSEYAQTPPAARAILRDAASDGEPFRVLVSPAVDALAPNRLATFGIQEANGYTSLEFLWHREFLRRVQRVDDDWLDLWNVRYVVEPARYGTLASYKGVDFLPGQALMQAPAGDGAGRETFRVPDGYAVNQVRFVTALVGGMAARQGELVATVDLLAEDRSLLARLDLRAGEQVMEWAWDQLGGSGVGHRRVEAAGQVAERSRDGRSEPRVLSYASLTLPAAVQPRFVQVRSQVAQGEFVLYGAALNSPAGASYQLFGRTKAKYNEIYRDKNVTVLENTAAYPRAFLVPGAQPVASGSDSYAQMARRPFDPRRVVIIPRQTPLVPSQSSAPGPAGLPIKPRVVTENANQLTLQVAAASDAYLVVSNTYYPGWTAYVDGRETPVVRGDMLFQAIPVPAGEHRVELRFQPASHAFGLAITLAAAGLALGLLMAAALWHSRMARPASSRAAPRQPV